MISQDTKARWAVAAALVAAAIAVLVTASTDGDFWWSDAPRHALNGAFVLDFIEAAPFRHPVDWAVNYYLRYPALTILFYPPLFYVAEAAMYALFGVHHLVAQATVTLFVLLLMWTSYRLARTLLPRASSLAVALMVVGAPEVMLWARQVMLDVPAYALATAAAWFFTRHGATRRTGDLYACAACAVAGVAIKQNAAFVFVVFGLVALLDRKWIALDAPRLLRLVAVTGLGLLPLVYLTYRFGSANVQSVIGRPGDVPRSSLAAWLYYAEQIPRGAGIVIAGLGGVGLVAGWWRASRDLCARRVQLLLVTWFAVAYLVFSLIGNHEPRHGLMMLWPLAVAAVLALHALVGPRLAQVLSLLLALGTFGHSLAATVSPRITGYPAVAAYVAAQAPRDAVVMFHGRRDGNFIYAMRAGGGREDITIVRTDKLFVRVIAGERLRGVEQSDLSEEQIEQTIRAMGVDLIVYQPGFWSDLRQMARFAAALQTPAYQEVTRFSIGGTTAHDDQTIIIYRPTYEVRRSQRILEVDMPMLRGQFRGPLAPREAQR